MYNTYRSNFRRKYNYTSRWSRYSCFNRYCSTKCYWKNGNRSQGELKSLKVTVKYKSDSTKADGAVLSQSLSAGEVVAKDTKITITVNKIEKKNNDKTNDNNTTNNENTTKPDNTVTHDPTNEVDEH